MPIRQPSLSKFLPLTQQARILRTNWLIPGFRFLLPESRRVVWGTVLPSRCWHPFNCGATGIPSCVVCRGGRSGYCYPLPVAHTLLYFVVAHVSVQECLGDVCDALPVSLPSLPCYSWCGVDGVRWSRRLFLPIYILWFPHFC